MIAEWGVYHRVGRTTDKAPGFASVLPELAQRPAIKARMAVTDVRASARTWR